MENSKKEKYLLIAVVIVGIALLSGLFLQWRNIDSRNSVSNQNNLGIVVNGEGIINIKPDIARISLGVETEAAVAQTAQEKNSELMAKIVEVLKSLGLGGKDIQTTDFNLTLDHQPNKETGRDQVVGYRASNQVTVTVRDLSKLGAVIDQSVQAGANNVNNVVFSVESPEKWRTKVIASAIRDARSKADEMAKAAGVKIIKVLSITESSIDLRPFQMNVFRKAESVDVGANSTPIEPGNVKVTANVQMSFGI